MLIKTTWLLLRHILIKFKLAGFRVAIFDKSDLQFAVLSPGQNSTCHGKKYCWVLKRWRQEYCIVMWQTSDIGDCMKAYICRIWFWRRCRKMDLLFSQEVSFYYVCQFILCNFVYSILFNWYINYLFIIIKLGKMQKKMQR